MLGNIVTRLSAVLIQALPARTAATSELSASIAVLDALPTTSILRGLACALTGSLIVSTPSTYSAARCSVVERVAEEELAAERALRTLADEQLYVIADRAAPLRVHREDVSLDGEIELGGFISPELALGDVLASSAIAFAMRRKMNA